MYVSKIYILYYVCHVLCMYVMYVCMYVCCIMYYNIIQNWLISNVINTNIFLWKRVILQWYWPHGVVLGTARTYTLSGPGRAKDESYPQEDLDRQVYECHAPFRLWSDAQPSNHHTVMECRTSQSLPVASRSHQGTAPSRNHLVCGSAPCSSPPQFR